VHTLVERVYQKCHRINLEDFVSQQDLKKLQEKPLDVQFNSQNAFGYMPPPKESWFRYMKSSKSEK
jgi:hypothetical protein